MERTLESTVLHTVKIRLTTDYPGQINTCIDALNDEQLWWRPNNESNSMANLVIHLAGSNRYYFGHVIDGEEDHRNRDSEFAARGTRSRNELRELWAESVA